MVDELNKFRKESNNQITLMVKDPTTIYTYWNISDHKKQMVELQNNISWKSLPKVLKIVDITSVIYNGHNAHKSFDLHLKENETYMFILNVECNRTYLAEIGITTATGQFFTLVRSNPIDTPRNHEQTEEKLAKDVLNWKVGKDAEPNWLEHFSSYSYYEKIQ